MFQQMEWRTVTAAPCRNQGALKISFLRAVGGSLKCTKIGSLLLSSGLVTQSELDGALATQRETGEPLGKILIDRGTLSAAMLYRKLVEQWCIKASTAGMAMMMQAIIPSAAQAAEDSIAPRFQMAAAAVNPASWRGAVREAERSYPNLFGTQEVRSKDISAFKKWTSAMSRFEDQMKVQGTSPRILMWKAELQNLKGLSQRVQIESVNAYVNEVRYVDDSENYKKSDYWATPVEFFSRGGDCEDFAIAKYASLRAIGFSSDQLRIAIVQDTWRNLAHAVLIVYIEDSVFVLDSQDKRVHETENVSRYTPIFSINSTHWWLHRRAVS